MTDTLRVARLKKLDAEASDLRAALGLFPPVRDAVAARRDGLHHRRSRRRIQRGDGDGSRRQLAG